MPFSLPSAYRLAASRRWGRRRSVTLEPTTGAAEGRREFLHFRPGFYISTSRIEHRHSAREVYASGDFIKLHFRLAGDSWVSQPGSAAQAVAAMSVSTLLQPPGASKEEVFERGVHERSVTLCCSRRFLVQEVGLPRGAHADDPLGAFLQAPATGFSMARFPLSAAQQTAATALVDGSPEDALASLWAESKAFELLHGALAGLAQPAPAALPPGCAAGSAPDRLAPLKHYIDDHLGEAFEAASLARRFGFSESSLARAFRQAHGMPLFEYVARARAERARLLLQCGELSVTDIALEVGYGHTANFSTAFKRRFGLSPFAFRKAARAGLPS